MAYDFGQDFDEDYSPHYKYSFGEKINSKKYSSDNKNTPFISYDYIVLDENLTHSFTQKNVNDQTAIDATDIIQYFRILKNLSTRTIDDIIDNTEHDLHFHVYQPNKINGNRRLKALIETVSGKQLAPETLPSVGQFALYTQPAPTKADRTLNVKSPRIYFILINATFYILFYDPFHEICP